MIYPLVLMVVAPVSGSLSDQIGSEILTFIGLIFGSLGLFQSPNNSLVMSTVPIDKLGIAGSINALIRNVGMVSGIALATTLLYTQMSYKIGHRVTNYVPGRNDAFIYEMRWVYIAAGLISLIGAGLTFFRLYNRKYKLKNNTISTKSIS